MTASPPFGAVIFDGDGVLVASERLVNDIDARLLSRLGLPLSPADTRARFKGHTVGEIVAILEALLQEPLPPDWLYDWGMHTALGFVRDLQVVPGVQPVLDFLAARKLPLGVASQAPLARVQLSLSITDLARYFDDRVFVASMVPRPKPCPDLFLLAAARLGIEPGRCVVIEDSPSGAVAAAAAGMAVFGYAADEDPTALAAAGATPFTDMAELPALLANGRSRPGEQDTRQASCDHLRDAYDRFFAGDPRGLAAFLADDVVYHLPGKHLGGGTLQGWTEILERTVSAARSCDDPPAMRLGSIVASRDVVLSLERVTARRRGRVLDQDVCVVWRLAGGRCAEVWSTFSDQRACDRFWEEP